MPGAVYDDANGTASEHLAACRSRHDARQPRRADSRHKNLTGLPKKPASLDRECHRFIGETSLRGCAKTHCAVSL